MPSRGFAAAWAVTRTMVSPERTTTAPSACLARRPVSIDSVCRPIVMLRVCMCASFAEEGRPERQPGDIRNETVRANSGAGRPALLMSVLLADAQTPDQLGIAVGILALQVVEEAATLADEFQEPAAGVMILRVRLEVLCQIVDALAQESDLNFRGTRVLDVGLVGTDDVGLAILAECHAYLHARPRHRRHAVAVPVRRCRCFVPIE